LREIAMSWFDAIQKNLHEVANKAGLTPEKLKQVSDTLNAELAKMPDHMKALKATAEQHGIEVDKIQAALEHAGTSISEQADKLGKDILPGSQNPPPTTKA
jgi:hypothetical protein